MPKNRYRTRLARAATQAVAVALSAVACTDADNHALRLHGETMGTYYAVTIARPPAVLAKSTPHTASALPTKSALRAELEEVLGDINRAMSTYLPQSEISRFNRHQSTAWFAVSAQFVEVVQAARAVSVLSDGAFDITVAPLVNLWGFGPPIDAPAPPSAASATPTATAATPVTATRIPRQEERRAALARIGYEKLHVRTAPPALRKLHPRVQIDVSGIAKGYAVDALARHLQQRGLHHFLVDIGGEIKTAGTAPGGRAWRVAVEKPAASDGTQRAVHAVLYPRGPRGAAVATSGDYRNYFAHEGRRFSHTLDPHSGQPVRHNLASVTVVAADAMRADALATMFMVAGRERGMKIATQHGLAASFITRHGSVAAGEAHEVAEADFDISHSPAFAVYLQEERATLGDGAIVDERATLGNDATLGDNATHSTMYINNNISHCDFFNAEPSGGIAPLGGA